MIIGEWNDYIKAIERIKGILEMNSLTHENKEEIVRLEISLLREVYESARQVLRFNGIDNDRTIKAINRLDDAIEQVKLLDSGFMNDDI